MGNFPEDRLIVYKKLVENNFSFLVEDYGFKLSDIEKKGNEHIVIKYVSRKVFINFYYGPPGFELDFYIGRLGVEDQLDRHSFTSGDLLYLGSYEKWTDYKVYSGCSYDNLRTCLPKLAGLLKECGDDCLKGKFFVYEKILFEQTKDLNRWYKNQELAQAKKVAHEAWSNKDYAEFVKLLEPFTSRLTLSENKKLEYARKHL